MGNTTTLADLAKELYPVDEIEQMEQLETPFLNEIEEGKGLEYSAANGGTFKFPVKMQGPHGQKMMNELEALPTATTSKVVQGTSYLKEYAGVLQFSNRELKLAKGDMRSFADAKTFEMENLILNAHKYRNRQIARGDGSGDITLVSGAQTAQTVIEVDDATPFQIGMVIDIWDSTGSTTKQADAVTVTAVDFLSATNSITVAAADAVTCDDDGVICLAGVKDNAASDGKEMIGLPLITDDGTLVTTFQGISRDTYPNYDGNSISVSGPIGVSVINQAMSRAYRTSGVDFVKSNDVFHLCSPEQWRGYASLANAQIRFLPGDAPDLNKSITQLECMGKRVIVDPDVGLTDWYTLKKSVIKMATAVKLDWESDLGGTTLKWLSGYNQGIMVLYGLFQAFSQNVREAIRLSDLTAVDI